MRCPGKRVTVYFVQLGGFKLHLIINHVLILVQHKLERLKFEIGPLHENNVMVHYGCKQKCRQYDTANLVGASN